MVKGLLTTHVERIRHQLGRKLRLGGNAYRLRGYCANRLATDLDDEPHVHRAIERVLARRTGAFLDVGVNIGQTLLKVLAIDPSRLYFGFEPQAACVFFVEQFIRDNDLSSFHVIPTALAENDGILPLYSDDLCDDMASLTGEIQVDGKKRRLRNLVPVRRGDAVVEEFRLDKIAAIKIDVEGAELNVLRGLTETLARYQPVVLFEVLPNFHGRERIMRPPDVCARENAAADAIFEFLTNAGYQIGQLDAQGGEHPIARFVLDDPEGFVSADYVAQPTSGLPSR